MRLAFDVTALHDARTGVGTFTGEVLERLARQPDVDVIAYATSWRGRQRVRSLAPGGVRVATRPMAARPLRALWQSFDQPPITWWSGAIDVVHGPNFVVPPAPHAAQLATVHDLTCIHHPELCTADVLQYPALLRRALGRGAHLHVVSRFVGDEVIDLLGADPARVHVIANGISAVGGGDAKRGAGLAGGDRYVLALGTVEPRKDLPTLVAAFDAVAADDDELRLVIAGPDGWGAEALTATVAAAAHRDRIVRLGWVDDASRADLLAGAAVFAYPSLYEGFGLPPLEAMAAGAPVVTTSAGALPEVVGEAAVLVAPRDVDALGAAVALLTGEGERDRRARIDRGQARAARFTWDATATALVSLYRSLEPSC
ncbi:MAG: glycosyltransferase family 1 protein [Acidimicrobiales bacterium]